MKKVLVAILLLVPLLVVMTISVSSTIISAEIKIELTTLRLTDRDGNVLSYVPIDIDDDNVYMLYASYFPKNASNKDLNWESSDTDIAKVKKRGNYCEITFAWGTYDKAVEITATSQSNNSVRAAVTFFLTGSTPNRIAFTDWSRNVIDRVDLTAGEKQTVRGVVIPSATKGDAKLEWSIDDPTVASVDANGIVTGLKAGAATTLRCRLPGSGISASIPVFINGTSLSNNDAYYTTEAYYNLLEAGNLAEGVTVYVHGEAVDPTHVPSDVTATLIKDNDVKTVGVYRVEPQDLVLVNRHLMEMEMLADSARLTKGSGDLRLEATDIYGNKVQGTWRSSNINVVRVDANGIVHALDVGTANVIFSADGYNDLVIPVEVGGVTVAHFNLELDNKDDAAGLAMERVFGIYTCDNKVVTNQLPLRISGAYPEDVMDHPLGENFDFTSSDERYATVDANGVVYFQRAGIGHTVTITAYAKQSTVVVSDSYTFKLVEGINVGYGKEMEYDRNEDPDGSIAANMDYSAYEDMYYVQNEYRGDIEANGINGALVLHSNMYVPSHMEWVELYRPVYGNGHTYDGQLRTRDYDDRLFGSWRWADYLPTLPEYQQNGHYELVVQNLVLQAYHPISADSEEAFKELKIHGGIPIRLGADWNNPNLLVVFRYCLFQYAYAHINVDSANCLLDGCILRNSAAPAILLQSKDTLYDGEGNPYPSGRFSDLTIRNCIVSNTIAPAMLATAGMLDYTMEELANLNYSRIRLEGENYIYNWKRIEELEVNIFPPADDSINAILEIVGNKISGSVQEVIKDEANAALVMTDVTGEKYINFSFLLFGFWTNYKMKENPAQELDPTEGFCVYGNKDYYRLVELDMKNAEAYFRSQLSWSYNVIMKSYPMISFTDNPCYMLDPLGVGGKPNTKPGETYEIDDKTIARLHGRA